MTDLVANADLARGAGLATGANLVKSAGLSARRLSSSFGADMLSADRGYGNWAIWLLFWAVLAMGCTMAVAVAAMDV
jgi:hypothetical protein